MRPNRIFSIIALLLLELSIVQTISAAKTFAPDTVSAKVFFVQGSSVLNPKYHDNANTLELLCNAYYELVNTPGVELNEFVVIPSSSASPEGNFALNQDLCMKRALNTARYLTERLQVQVDATSGDYEIDWKLLEEALEKSDVYYRDKALKIIRNTPVWVIKHGQITDSRKRQLMNLYGGKAWEDMLRNVFYDMRYATIRITYKRRPVLPEPAGITCSDPKAVSPNLPDTLVVPTYLSIKRQPKVALHNNMLLDVLAVPNVGLEFALGKHISVGADWMYAWWNPNSTFYWRIYGGDAYLRCYPWAAKKHRPFTGQHFGVYGGIVTYDFEMGIRGNMGERWSWFAGLEYGVSIPITKRLNLDLNIGAGYLGGEYKVYDYEEGYYVWKYTARRNWMGPCKAEASLVWLLGGKKKYKPVNTVMTR